MARFINEKQQRIEQAPSSFLHYFFLIVIVMEFIRLPDVFGMPPVYLVTGLCPLIILFHLKNLPVIRPIVIKIILLLLFYNVYAYVLAWGLDIQKEKGMDVRYVGIAIKNSIQLMLFSIVCTNLLELKRITFTITITIFISAAFGLLTYHFGGPFETIRDWLWQSRLDLLTATTEGKGGKGQFVTGLSGTHWLFGYTMTAGPALALVCGRLSRVKWVWVIVFLVMCYALYLNGQRAAFAPSFLIVIALLLHWRLISIPAVCVIAVFVLATYVPKLEEIEVSHVYHLPDKELTLADRFQRSGHDSKSRFSWWKSGAISVIESPWIGPTRDEYSSALHGATPVVNSPDRRKPFAHNAYINPGIFIGIPGWIIVLTYFAMLKKVLTQVFTAVTEHTQEKIIFQGVAITLMAPMLNAMFQNGSIFSGESTNVFLTGLLFSCYQMAHKQSTTQFNRYRSKNKYA